MRNALTSLVTGSVPEHLALAYDSWAPVANDGKVPEDRRAEWLGRLENMCVPLDYRHAFERWKSSFTHPGDRVIEMALRSRLLLGHGNASATDVGLTVHHTWGVPVIPGSALKGLLAHYVDAVYGPEKRDRPDGEQERAPYQGVTWRGSRIKRGPGEIYRALFGAPDAEEDELMHQHGFRAGAAAGYVVFHDALYVPADAKNERPFAADVLTVHQKSYYDASRKRTWPNDYDSPNPVSFLTVRPGARFLFALSGPADWTALAERLLMDALDKWGVGGKTSSGYGRLVISERAPERQSAGSGRPGLAVAGPGCDGPEKSVPQHRRGERIFVTRVKGQTSKGKPKFAADDGRSAHFTGEEPPDVEEGKKIEVWVANANAEAYTITRRPPQQSEGSRKR